MDTYIDACPKCKAGAVRVTFERSEGYSATRTDPGEAAGVYDIRCCRCGETLDDDEDVVAACVEEVATEMESAQYPDL